jgi:hypothetical protein
MFGQIVLNFCTNIGKVPTIIAERMEYLLLQIELHWCLLCIKSFTYEPLNNNLLARFCNRIIVT